MEMFADYMFEEAVDYATLPSQNPLGRLKKCKLAEVDSDSPLFVDALGDQGMWGTQEEESSPPGPATHVDKAEHMNVGSTTYWGCVNKTIYITGDKESVATGGHDNQAGTNDTGSKIYVACRIENYHVTVTDRTT
ncbi:hypothetical protein Bbelb_074340 [Branchiostoma belcheri]|nr:hypothetical protein Bbelb_074340 [Branchiostoma belcheri]